MTYSNFDFNLKKSLPLVLVGHTHTYYLIRRIYCEVRCTPDAWTNPPWQKLFGREWIEFIFVGVYIIPRSWNHPPPFLKLKTFPNGKSTTLGGVNFKSSGLFWKRLAWQMTCHVYFNVMRGVWIPFVLFLVEYILNCFEVDKDQIILKMFLCLKKCIASMSCVFN